jgi:hypothetical protein
MDSANIATSNSIDREKRMSVSRAPASPAILTRRNREQAHALPEGSSPCDLTWPPVGAAAMRALQSAFGDDAAISSQFRLSRATVYIYRRRLGVAALPRGKDRRVREKRPRARLSNRAMAQLYRGRSYEDAALRRRPDNAVRGVGWVF